MAANERAMVEAARAYYDKVLDYSAATIIELMAGFASEQSALAVATERTRVADELERITNGSSCEINLLIQQLRAERANDEKSDPVGR